MRNELELKNGEVRSEEHEIVFPSEVIHTSDPTAVDLDYCLHHMKEIRYRLSRLAQRFESQHQTEKFVRALGYLDVAEGVARSISDD